MLTLSTFLNAIGYWNFFGSVLMLFFLNEKFGKQVLNEWTKIFKTEFQLNYWSKLWLFWAAGINVFFGLINVMAVEWNNLQLQLFMLRTDLIAYSVFISLSVWGWRTGHLGSGVYSVWIIFLGWIIWGVLVYPL